MNEYKIRFKYENEYFEAIENEYFEAIENEYFEAIENEYFETIDFLKKHNCDIMSRQKEVI